MSIESQVRELRKKHGLNQSELAEIAGTSRPSLSRFERGQGSISLETLRNILQALGYQLEICSIKKEKEKENRV